jgi:hypothetical protein
MADDETNEPMGDEELDPTVEPKSSRAWLAIIAKAEKVFQDYQDRADNIDKLYANLEKLGNASREREFQLFWANIQVIGPSIYSRAPVPVVVPRFKDQRPLARMTSELLERSCVVTFQLEDMDGVMRLVRDDVTVLARGCIWLRYETKQENDGVAERVCIEHVDRKDFLHDPARNWKEVDWVAKRSWLTEDEMEERFKSTSGDAYMDASYELRRDDKDADDGRMKCGVWEIWSKSQDKVVWVCEGCEDLLDDGPPHLTLEGFFPCPKPAYGTVQRRSMIPVPDMVFYKDQLEEINELTARISALSESVKLKGFYPSGNGEVGDAIEAAIKATDNNAILIPISNWSLLGTGSSKDMIIWLPIDMVATVITQLVELRRQLIDDVYQITGLSDIMRGSTVASETLGAQQLKSQYGSIRIRDRQDELIRIARDVTRIAAEIMSENFQSKTMLDMSQMQIPTDADIAKQVKPLEAQIQQITKQVDQAKANPQIQQQAQQNPDQAKQMLQQAQDQANQLGKQINDLQSQPTVEKISKFLRDQRLRPFVLDIETDSTIAPDEDAQKQRATEYVQAMGGLLAQGIPAIMEFPAIGPVVADTIKFMQSQFRVGRQMDQTVEEFVDQVKKVASQPKPPDPAVQKAQADSQAMQAKVQMDAQAHQQNMQAGQAKMQMDAQQHQIGVQQNAANLQLSQQESASKAQAAQVDIALKQQAAQQEMQLKAQESDIKVRMMQAEGQMKAEAHGHLMQKGALELAKLQAEIDHLRTASAATVANTQIKADTAAEAAAAKKEPA